uniref:Dymeclin n=1 Tax=Panagrellus redivivus TaxID=6233 RepID=A0A7E4VAF6_PANRE
MGQVISSEDNLAENELLLRLSGKKVISDNDPFWNHLFSFNFTIDESKRCTQKEFYDSLQDILQSFLYNAPTTGNFATLVKVFLRRHSELDISASCDNKIFIWQTANSLIIMRYLFTFFLQRLSQVEFAHHLEPKAADNDSDGDSVIEDDADDEYANVAERLLGTLVDVVVSIPVNESTLRLHAEVIRVLLVLLSPTLFEENVSEDVYFLKLLMNMSPKANEFMRVLFSNYLHHTEVVPTELKETPSESIVLSVASSIWSSFARTVSLDTSPVEPKPDITSDVYPKQTLANLSNALILSLVCYNKYDGKLNPFKMALEKCTNSQEVSSLTNLEASFRIDFSEMYVRFCDSCTESLPMLLLYMLIHRNTGFRNFILARINLENLVVPIVRALNEGISATEFRTHCRHTYLAMIVLLIFSEDNFFCKIVHETIIKNIDWFHSDRVISEITLGGLIILVCVKTVHLNTARMRDRYLHQNCLAALANMSAGFRDLPASVCQKIVGLLETMTRRHVKLIQMMRENAEECEDHEDSQGYDLHQDITALEEGIRTVLEMINACLTHNLRHNSHLIYSILYNRHLFEQFHNHPMFQDLVWNIYMVINHFATVVSDSKSTSVSAVHEVIAQAALQWPTDKLKKFPDLKFKYVEDENTVDFFVPYVWRLVCSTSGVYFPLESVKLFTGSQN